MASEIGIVNYEEGFILNARGLKLFTSRWLPAHCEPKAIIFLCHGYAMECSISMKGCGIRLAMAGFAVYGIDYEGHGKSSGIAGYIPCFNDLVNDCNDHFTNICEMKENINKMKFLMGQSMGGSIALLLERMKPQFWDGAILMAPMCKIADEIRPHPIVAKVLKKLCNVIPTWKIIPTHDIIDVAFRNPKIRKEIRSNPYCYKGRPRLQTGRQLIKATMDLENKLQEVSCPFLIVHGDEDKIIDPSASKFLYESASSIDKTMKLYPGMWHDLLYGELPENINIVFSDIINWLDEKVILDNSKLERGHKLSYDNLVLIPQSSKRSL